VFHGFHVAGTGAGLCSGGGAPKRSLIGWRYLGMEYINTCNGILLLARKKFSCPCRCILWNPAVDDGVKEVTLHDPQWASEYQVLGLGYGRRGGTYKLLPCHKERFDTRSREYPRATCSLAGDAKNKEPTILSTVLAARFDGEIVRQESLYADGRIYLPANDKTKAILAFDVDDETITSVGLPTRDDLAEPDKPRFFSKIMQLSGRPCVAVQEDFGSGSQDLWLLSADHQWVRRCLLVDSIHVLSLTAGFTFSRYTGRYTAILGLPGRSGS
jgi:hypothetical protein